MNGNFVTKIQIMWWRKHVETAVNVLRNLSKWKSPTLTTFKCLALVFIYLWPRFWTKLLRKAIYKWRRGIICNTNLFITWNSDQSLWSTGFLRFVWSIFSKCCFFTAFLLSLVFFSPNLEYFSQFSGIFRSFSILVNFLAIAS